MTESSAAARFLRKLHPDTWRMTHLDGQPVMAVSSQGEAVEHEELFIWELPVRQEDLLSGFTRLTYCESDGLAGWRYAAVFPDVSCVCCVVEEGGYRDQALPLNSVAPYDLQSLSEHHKQG